MHLGPLRLAQGISRATPSRFNKRPAGGALPMQKARPCLPCCGAETGSLKGSWGGRSPNKAGSGVGPRPRGPEALGQLGSPAGRPVQGLSPYAGTLSLCRSGRSWRQRVLPPRGFSRAGWGGAAQPRTPRKYRTRKGRASDHGPRASRGPGCWLGCPGRRCGYLPLLSQSKRPRFLNHTYT